MVMGLRVFAAFNQTVLDVELAVAPQLLFELVRVTHSIPPLEGNLSLPGL